MDKQTKQCGIYQILNTNNNKRYIGLSVDIYTRWQQHKQSLKNQTHRNIHLQRAWNIYGEESFDFSILELCDKEELAKREIFWIQYYDSFNNGYNMTGGGDGTSDVVFSEERNRKISEAQKGKYVPSGKDNPNAKSVVCLNTRERLSCIVDAAKAYNIRKDHISKSCKNHSTISNNHYVFMYENDYDKMSEESRNALLIDSIENAVSYGNRKTAVVCLNTKCVYPSAKELAKSLGNDYHNLMSCCRGQKKSWGKSENGERLVWMFYYDYLSATDEDVTNRIAEANATFTTQRARKILCVNTGEIFPSIRMAAKYYSENADKIRYHIDSHGEYTFSDSNHNTIVLKSAS